LKIWSFHDGIATQFTRTLENPGWKMLRRSLGAVQHPSLGKCGRDRTGEGCGIGGKGGKLEGKDRVFRKGLKRGRVGG